jgi:hypothetical protein
MLRRNKNAAEVVYHPATGGGFEDSPDLFRLPGLQDLESGAGVQDADDIVYRVPRVRRFEHTVQGAARAPVAPGASWRTSL